MPVASYARRSVFLASPDETVQVAAQRMETEGVGLLIVVAGGRPSGLLTDRDVALQLPLGPGQRVSQVMNRRPHVVRGTAPLSEAIGLMVRHGVRRLPVVDAQGHSVGVIANDDIVQLVAGEIAALAAAAAAQLPAKPLAVASASAEDVRERSGLRYLQPVVSVPSDAKVLAAVEQMRHHAVGAVVIVDAVGAACGIVTDRDLAVRVVARGLDARTTTVSSVMSSPVLSCDSAQPFAELVEKMRSAGVRRVPLLREGRLVGMVSYDDLLAALGEELAKLGRGAVRQQRRERRRVRNLDALRRLRRGFEQAGRSLGAFVAKGGAALRGRGPTQGR